MLIIPLNLDSVLLLLYNSKLAYSYHTLLELSETRKKSLKLLGSRPVNPRVPFRVFYLSKKENLVPLNLLRCNSQNEVTQQYRPTCIVIKVNLKLNISALKLRCQEIEGNQNTANKLYPKAM